MANVVMIQERVPENLKKQLAVTVRSIQWSYAIFWSLSDTKQGVLHWGDGYYNGDIKTRKTVQAMEFKADKLGLQRSEQLRELYESLLDGETDQTKRPSIALSPEDLSNAEWYYLVCMSFVFSPGQGLAGRAFAKGETIWLCNAQYADSKIFSRSLLAKSASIQTVLCFPYLGGLIELGVTELVPEDPNLLQHIKASLLDVSKPVCSEKSSSTLHNADEDRYPVCVKVDHKIVDLLDLENLYSPTEVTRFDQDKLNEIHENIKKDFYIGFPDECSNGIEQDQEIEDSFMLEDMKGVASQVQIWHFMDDEFNIQEKAAISSCKQESANHSHFKQLQEDNHPKISSLNFEFGDDLHYKRTLSAILGASSWLIRSQGFHSFSHKSSFFIWKNVGMTNFHRPRVQQKVIKKILFAVPLMHADSSLMFQKENGGKHCLEKSENDDDVAEKGCFLREKRKEEEKFFLLKSMVPCMSENDKESILKDTINYLKKLDARVEELESCKNSIEFVGRHTRKSPDVVEQTSDNYETRKVDNVTKFCRNKRKACDIDESYTTGSELNRVIPKNGLTTEVKVSIKDAEVIIEIRCPSRELLLLDIMDAINNLHLDAHTVQSSTLEGIVVVTLKSKFQGAAIAPAGMIKQALQRAASM